MSPIRRTLLTEVAPALALAALVLFVTPRAAEAQDAEIDALTYVLCAVAGLAPGLWRRAPVLAYALPLACVMLYTARDYPGGPIYLTFFAGTLAMILNTATRVWLPAVAVGGLALLVAHVVTDARPAGAVGAFVVWVFASVVVGETVRVRRDKLREAEQRAAWAERNRAEEARRQVAEERLRIARDVHDIVGHSLATITLQAGVAEHLLEERPEQARAAVAAIRRVGKESMAELQGLLGPLRAGDDAPRAPAPGLDALPRLVADMRAAGLAVELERDGDAAPVPELVAVAAFRIVQEALTNVARHAGPGAQAVVRLDRRAGALEVEVADDGAGAPAGTREGNGLTGMRERAAATGGQLDAGPRAGGGYRVLATLPTP
jgi:signal transduction histidine kinase